MLYCTLIIFGHCLEKFMLRALTVAFGLSLSLTGILPTTNEEAAALLVDLLDTSNEATTEISEQENGSYSLTTAPLDTEEFQAAGIIWEGTSPARVEVRSKDEKGWSNWAEVGIEKPAENRQPGSEPYIAAGATGIQVRAVGKELPTDLKAVLLTGEKNTVKEKEITPNPATENPDSNKSPEQVSESTTGYINSGTAFTAENASAPLSTTVNTQVLTTKSAAITAGAPALQKPVSFLSSLQTAASRAVSIKTATPARPTITSRAGWGAGRAGWNPSFATLRGAVVHHTAGSNNYTASEVPGIIRSIFHYHTYTLEWGDIGYNFLIDKYGNIYEGREGTLRSPRGQMAVGAHAYGANTHSVGISILGSYMYGVQPTTASLNSLQKVIAWQFGMGNVNPYGSWVPSTGKQTPNIAGHRDVFSTACPGSVYEHLGAVRAGVKQILANANNTNSGGSTIPGSNVNSTFTNIPFTSNTKYTDNKKIGWGWPNQGVWAAGDFLENGYSDMLLRTRDGRLLIYDAQAGDSWASPRQIGNGWNIFTELYTGVDFDGDSHIDIIGKDATGRLFLYPSDGNGYFRAPRQIGNGWNIFKSIFLVEKGINNQPTFYGINSRGQMYAYPTNGRSTFYAPRLLSGNYAAMQAVGNAGDWNTDGKTDIIFLNEKKELLLGYGSTAGFTKFAKIGHGWGVMSYIGRAHMAGNKRNLYAVAKDGKLYRYEWEWRR